MVDDDQVEIEYHFPKLDPFLWPLQNPGFSRIQTNPMTWGFLRYQSYSSAIGRISGFFGFHLLDLMYVFTYSYHKTQPFMQLNSFKSWIRRKKTGFLYGISGISAEPKEVSTDFWLWGGVPVLFFWMVGIFKPKNPSNIPFCWAVVPKYVEISTKQNSNINVNHPKGTIPPGPLGGWPPAAFFF